MRSVANQIHILIDAAELAPHHFDVINESHMHNVPKDSETHFKVVLVSDKFKDLPRVRRHQLINQILSELIGNPIHALALHLYTPEEWAARNQAPDSPNCLGGRKKETR